MAPGDRPPIKPGPDLRLALIQTAFDLLDAQGLARVSVRAAARRLDIHYSFAARYFPDRKALLTEMAAATLRELTRRITDARASSPPGCKRARAVGAAVFEYATGAPNRYALCWRFDEMRVEDEGWRAAGDDLCAQLREVFASHPCDATDSLVAAGSLLNGYVVLRHSGALSSTVPSGA